MTKAFLTMTWVQIKGMKLAGWVDSDFASDIDSRKSMTGYLMSLNGGSWKSL